MKQLLIANCRDKIRLLGRTYEEKESNILYFNWTCSGVELEFTGSYLLADFFAHSTMEYDQIPPKEPAREIWPWVAVFLDEEEEPIQRFEIDQEKKTCLIFASEKIETHKIRIIKLSENAKGKVGILALAMEGNLLPRKFNQTYERYIEFIGDSITCGFGNETTERDRFFYTGEENGWMSHAAIAARLLKADYSIISVSGITAGTGIEEIKWNLMPMDALYPYTDRLLEEQLDRTRVYTEWDFASKIPDIIVINLGTNDSTVISFEGDIQKGEAKFETNYSSLLNTIRKLNGPKPLIICALGPMDYYLYSNIERVVSNYSLNTGDHNLLCFRYGKIKLHEGYGACGHPSLATQIRMGTELADFINTIHS